MERCCKQKSLNSQKTSALMTEGIIWKKIIFFAMPLVLGNLLQQMYNAVDSIVVGNYVGSDALAAVTSSTSLTRLLIAFSQGTAVGAGVVVSQCLGAKDQKGVQSAVHTALAISGVLGLVLSAAGIFCSRYMLLWMHTPSEVLESAVSYLQIYSGGLLFNVLYNMCAGILNAVGNSKRSLSCLAAASIINILLDLILVGELKLGVSGAAVATDISQIIACMLALLFLVRTPADYQVKLRQICFHREFALKMLKIGLPTGIQNMVISLSNVLVQSSVNDFGVTAMAGFGAHLKIDGFNIQPVMGIGMAATTFVGQNFGAEKIDRMKKGIWVTVILGIIYTTFTGILLLAFAEPILGLFTDDMEAIEYGKLALKFFCPFYFILGITQILAGAVRGTGRSIPPMVILLVSFCVCRVGWIRFIAPYFSTIAGIYVSYPVSWFIGMVLMILYTWKGKWTERVGT